MNENPENIVPTTKFPLIFIKSLSVLSKKQFSSHYTVASSYDRICKAWEYGAHYYIFFCLSTHFIIPPITIPRTITKLKEKKLIRPETLFSQNGNKSCDKKIITFQYDLL